MRSLEPPSLSISNFGFRDLFSLIVYDKYLIELKCERVKDFNINCNLYRTIMMWLYSLHG